MIYRDLYWQPLKLQNSLLMYQNVYDQNEKGMRGSRNFRQGGGVQVSLTKKALTMFFFSPPLILQKSNGQFQRNLSFFKVPGSPTFSGGGGVIFSRGGWVQLLISFRKPI